MANINMNIIEENVPLVLHLLSAQCAPEMHHLHSTRTRSTEYPNGTSTCTCTLYEYSEYMYDVCSM